MSVVEGGTEEGVGNGGKKKGAKKKGGRKKGGGKKGDGNKAGKKGKGGKGGKGGDDAEGGGGLEAGHVTSDHVPWALGVLRSVSIDYYTTAERLSMLVGLFVEPRDRVSVITAFYARVLNRARFPLLLQLQP